jgi:transposase
MVNKHICNKSFSIGCVEVVKQYAKKLGFPTIFNRFKSKADKLSKFVTGFVSHKLHYNQSINHATTWINQQHILEELELNNFEPKTGYRNLATIGRHEKAIMSLIQYKLLSVYNFDITDCNIDWSSIVVYGDKSKMGALGYSRDHRPDKKQITFGISEYVSPINIPVALTIQAGNILDKQHFQVTFKRTLKALNKGSLIITDKGANTKENKELITSCGHHYLFASTMSKFVDEKILNFDKDKAVFCEEKNGKKVFCHQYIDNSEFCYLYFSEKLYDDQIRKKRKNTEKYLLKSKEMQEKVLSKRRHKHKTHQLQDFIATETLTLQKRLETLPDDELKKKIFEESLTGREGFFLLVSSKNLTHSQALTTYRKRDSIEKMMDSLKNVIKIKPIRVWTDDEIKGALIIGFLAQLIISLLKYEHTDLKDLHPKTIVESIRNLTLTTEYETELTFHKVISNIDTINQHILTQKTEIT